MTDPRIEDIVEEIKNKLLDLKIKKFNGKMTVDVDHKDGGMSSAYIAERGKIF